jgi:hypothetical protein
VGAAAADENVAVVSVVWLCDTRCLCSGASTCACPDRSAVESLIAGHFQTLLNTVNLALPLSIWCCGTSRTSSPQRQ